jgi:hypothetical protein
MITLSIRKTSRGSREVRPCYQFVTAKTPAMLRHFQAMVFAFTMLTACCGLLGIVLDLFSYRAI